MQELVTPKQVARAIDVSESSVKRWCNNGTIQGALKTAGGHRRIPIASVLSYLRDTNQPLVAPEVLGLPATSGRTTWVVTRARDCLRASLLEGDYERARQVVFDLFLAGKSLPDICDDVIADAFRQIGAMWSCNNVDIYQERRACGIMERILGELQIGIPPGDRACLAIGGTIPQDQYALPTKMVELVLQSCGWSARSLGNSIPYDSFAVALRETRPRIFWLSVSYIADVPAFSDGFRVIKSAADDVGAAIVVGGFALDDAIRGQVTYTAHCDNMRQLGEFAKTLRGTVTDS